MLRLKIRLLCTLVLALQSIIAHQFVPRGDIQQRNGNRLQRRLTCEAATPDVSENAVFTDVCNENPQNSFTQCFNSLVQYAQESALNICNRYYTLYNSCLVANNYSETTCADSRAGYVYCSNYTIQAYAYCGCYFANPEQLYNCANVELEIDSHKTLSPAPSGTILSSALLNGPIAPSTGTLSNIPSSAPTSNLPGFTRQSSTLLTSTVSVTSTFITTSCSSGVSNCPATTYSSTFASASSYWACGSAGCVIPPSSLPPASVPTTASTAPGGTQSTSTLITTVPVTRTSTITTCPRTVTPCPSHYSSESTYTTTTVSTILSCDGGCEGAPARAGECVVRKRTTALRAREL